MTGASIHVRSTHVDVLVRAAVQAHREGRLDDAKDLDELARRTQAALALLPLRGGPKEARAALPGWRELPSPLEAYFKALDGA